MESELVSQVNNLVVYHRSYRLRDGFLTSFRDIWSSISFYSLFIKETALREIGGQYRQSFARVLWILINPILPILIYVLMQWAGIMARSEVMPALVFVAIGMTFWTLIAQTITSVMSAPEANIVFLQKAGIPLIVTYISALGLVLYEYLIRIALIYLIMVSMGIPFNLYWIMAPLLGLPLIMLGFSIGVFCSFFALHAKDVSNIVSLVLRYGIFAVGAVFPIPERFSGNFIFSWNPIYVCIDYIRQVLVFGGSSVTYKFVLFFGLTFLLFLLSLKKAHNIEKIVISTV